MENEQKNANRNFWSKKFVWSEYLAEWKTVLSAESKNIFICTA